MKCLILLSFVALCYSQSVFVGRQVAFKEDGGISILGLQGREINIYKNGYNPKKLDVYLRNQYGVTRKIVIDEAKQNLNLDLNNVDSQFENHWTYFQGLRFEPSQYEILFHLFHPYKGVIQPEKYEELMNVIQYITQYGVLHEYVLDILRYFDSHDFALKHLPWTYYMKSVPVTSNYNLEHQTGDVSYERNYYPYAQQYKYRPANWENWTPSQRIQFLLQQYKYNQGMNSEHLYKFLYQQQDAKYHQNWEYEYPVHEKYEHVYPWAKDFNQWSNQPGMWSEEGRLVPQQWHKQPVEYSEESWVVPQQWAGQSQWEHHWTWTPMNQQQEYFQGYYPQQWWNFQKWNKQYVPEQWNWQQRGFYGQVPQVY